MLLPLFEKSDLIREHLRYFEIIVTSFCTKTNNYDIVVLIARKNIFIK